MSAIDARLSEVISPTKEGVVISLLVSPRARRSCFGGVHNKMLKVDVSAPPSDGKANDALLKLLAEFLRVPRSELNLLSGHRGRRKRVLVRSADREVVLQRLAQNLTSLKA